MNVLIVGAGAGSWTMRGHQLGAALGARVTSLPADRDFAWADVVVLVKRAVLAFGAIAAATKKPLVWDALDFWHQPTMNSATCAEGVVLARQYTAVCGPLSIIGATEAMAQALGGRYLPHHCWQHLSPTPARATVSVVAYQGEPTYLCRWHSWLVSACMARGWQFTINPPDLSAADLIVAFRDGPFDGDLCRHWKSGVKIVNAIAAGRPLITQWSAAFQELTPDGTWIETPAALGEALDTWSDYGRRVRVVERSVRRLPALRVDAVAEIYRALLEEVACLA